VGQNNYFFPDSPVDFSVINNKKRMHKHVLASVGCLSVPFLLLFIFVIVGGRPGY
jgi:hypothetical protein